MMIYDGETEIEVLEINENSVPDFVACTAKDLIVKGRVVDLVAWNILAVMKMNQVAVITKSSCETKGVKVVFIPYYSEVEDEDVGETNIAICWRILRFSNIVFKGQPN